MRFAERIECAIVEYHARDCVDRARFVNGVFDMTGIVYYASVIALFLFLSVQSLEKRRYN